VIFPEIRPQWEDYQEDLADEEEKEDL